MALDMIAAVENAENAAAKIKSDVQLEIAEIFAKAEADGKAAVENAKKKASGEVSRMNQDLDAKAEDDIADIASETEKTKSDLTAAGEFYMNEAVEMIKERIKRG